MNILLILILFLFIVIFSIYLSIIIYVKVNITYNEATIVAKFVLFGISKQIKLKLNYLRIINWVLSKNDNESRKYDKIKGIKKVIKQRIRLLLKPFYIKNINFYSECFDDKFSFAIEFSIVNIIVKRGVLSEQ